MSGFFPHPIIAREGWPFIIGGLVVSILLTIFACWWSLPFWIFTIFALQFFRDPGRDAPQDKDAVLSPVDGRIVVVEKATDPYRQVEALKISIFMNVFNVHSQRSPIDGTVTAVEYNKGKFVNAALDKASTENERNAVLATTVSGRELTFVQVAGLVARRILCYTQVGDSLRRGERYGFIRFGSRVDVYLPTDARAEVAIGDKVSGTSTIIARLPLTAPSENADANADTSAAQQAEETPTTPVANEVNAATAQPNAAATESTAQVEVSQTDIEASAEKVRQAVENEFSKD